LRELDVLQRYSAELIANGQASDVEERRRDGCRRGQWAAREELRRSGALLKRLQKRQDFGVMRAGATIRG
jgi:hypothetical protein